MGPAVRYLRAAALFTASVVLSGDLAAQSAHSGSTRANAWAGPSTSDGQPDLEGHWTNDTYTPLERPAELADKEFFTPEEAAAFVKSRVDRAASRRPRTTSTTTMRSGRPRTTPRQQNLRTSLIVEPRDGKRAAADAGGSGPCSRSSGPRSGPVQRRTARRADRWPSAASPGAMSVHRCCRPPTTPTCRSCRRAIR